MESDKITKAYSSPSWWYDIRGFFILTFAYRNTLWEQIRFFAADLKSPHLEVAIGSGTLFWMILAYRRIRGLSIPEEIIGIDYVDRILDGARHKFGRNKRFRLECMDAAHLPMGNGIFRSINIANAFHCFSDPDAALKEMYRVLADDGVLRLNAILHPGAIWPFKQISKAIFDWGMKKGNFGPSLHCRRYSESIDAGGISHLGCMAFGKYVIRRGGEDGRSYIGWIDSRRMRYSSGENFF